MEPLILNKFWPKNVVISSANKLLLRCKSGSLKAFVYPRLSVFVTTCLRPKATSDKFTRSVCEKFMHCYVNLFRYFVYI